LAIPEEIEVLNVNGTEVKGARGLLRRGDVTLELEPGRYAVLAYYRELWRLGEQEDVLRSDPVVFDLEAQGGARYRLGYRRPASYEEARDLAAHFSGWVEGGPGGARTPTRDSGLRFGGDFVLAGGNALVPALAGDGRGVAPLGAPRGGALDALQDAWQRATPEERREFLRRVGVEP